MPSYVYDPWYLRTKPPVFWMCCLPCYKKLFPARSMWLFLSVALWIIGISLLITIIILCITIDCGVVFGIVLIIAFIILWIGYLIFHCAWAAHLLEGDNGRMQEPIKEDQPDKAPQMESQPFHEPVDEQYDPEKLKNVKVGYWQFAERDAWQAVSSRDRLQ